MITGHVIQRVQFLDERSSYCGMCSILRKMARVRTETSISDELEAEEVAGTGLKRVLSFPAVILFGFSSVIGSGIFTSTGEAAYKYTGYSLYISYILGAVACILTGICYIDFSTRLPSAGGSYTFVYVSLGEFMAFIAGISLTLEYGISAAASARGASGYLRSLFTFAVNGKPEWVSNSAPDGHDSMFELDLIAPTLCCILTIVSLFGLKTGQRISSILSVTNLFLIAFIIIGASTFFDSSNFTGDREFELLPKGLRPVLRATANIFFTYIGWDSVCCLSEEVEQPKKTIPRATAVVIGLVGAIYCTIAILLIGLVPSDQINLAAPFAEGFYTKSTVFATVMSAICSVGVVLCTCNSVYSCTVGQPRVWYGMARDGLLPPQFRSVVGENRTPVFSILATGALTVVFSMFFKFDALQGMISAGVLLLQAKVCAGSLLWRLGDRGGLVISIAIGALCLSSLGCGLSLLGGQWPEQNNMPISQPVLWEAFFASVALILASVAVIAFQAGIRNMAKLLVPIVALFANMFFMGSLSLTALGLFILLCAGASPLYFLYGLRHSTLNDKSAVN